jgi:hypothetical protein
MSEEMETVWTWYVTLPGVVKDYGDAADWYKKARVQGLEVVHSTKVDCYDFDSDAGNFGVFRGIGKILFNKDQKRWRVIAWANCDTHELATLIMYGCMYERDLGERPGYSLRGREWEHKVNDNGDHIAVARVCYKLTVEDLNARASVAISVPDSLAELVSL